MVNITIVKRDGREEPFQPNKLNAWGEWAAETLGDAVDWSSVVLEAVGDLASRTTSVELQERLIRTCLMFDTWAYNRMAGRLYVALRRKELFPDGLPKLKEHHTRLQDMGLMSVLDYSDDEYDYLDTIIHHDKDMEYTHFQIHTHITKYAISNRVTGEHYETSQYMYMRMAMAICVDLDRSTRMEHVTKLYDHLSNNRLSAPTPNHVNLGTPLKGYASCCVYKTGDSAASIAVGNHIANTMTYMSAGIGSFMDTRSLLDPVRGGVIRHQGKLPYYRAVVGEIKANLQNGRGGAATMHFSLYDPEVLALLRLKNPLSTEDMRIRGLDYSGGYNQFFSRKAAMGEDIFLFNSYTAPDLQEALYSGDEDLFATLYEKYENDPEFEKKYVSAREILIAAENEWNETGRVYEHNLHELNKHTPFKDTIYSSNLCVVGDTQLTTDEGDFPIVDLVGQNVNVWNGVEFTEAPVVKTGEDQTIVDVELNLGDDTTSIGATEYHKWWVMRDGEAVEVRTYELTVGDVIEPFHLPNGELVHPVITSITTRETKHDTYCVREPKTSKATFNGILTGQCQEIALPTRGYEHILDLYSESEDTVGEVATCNLAGICVDKIESDDQYAEVAYYALLMIDKTIHLADYVLTHVGVTAKARLNAGVGILGLAHYMASKHLPYSSYDGKRELHRVAERHYYHLLKASLRLGKEFGNAPWMHKTKWPEGWLPLDTYNRNVDKIVDVDLQYDWESLRSEIVANGGIRNSVLVAHMPTETSANAAGTTNGLYPIRELTMIKTDNERVNYWAAPNSDYLGQYYESAWDIPTKDMTDMYAIMQKFTDQGISADFYRKVIRDTTISSSELIRDHLYRVRMGLKTKYYMNQKTSEGSAIRDYSGVDFLNDEDDAECSSCTL